MEFFEKLGAAVERQWQAIDRDERAFPEIAVRAISEADPQRNLGYLEAIREALTGRLLPQADPEASFGEPPLTLYTGGGFFIDLLFWLDGTTSIHQHAF